MRRILLICGLVSVLALAAAAAVAHASGSGRPGYLVVRRAASAGGVNGRPVVTVVVRGFVLARISQEAQVDVYHLQSPTGQGAPQVKGTDVSTAPVYWKGLRGTRYSGSNFRLRATGSFYRVVVRGSGVYVFAGGRGRVWLGGSSVNQKAGGTYSVDGSRVRPMPTQLLKRELGRG